MDMNITRCKEMDEPDNKRFQAGEAAFDPDGANSAFVA
jgi:hypothetical protein